MYDAGLEKVWKRSQRRVGLAPRRLYAQRHSFLSHALAMGNSPADLAAVAGHRTEELLRKNSRYGSVDLILNEAVGVFYASERKKGFR